ncbi:hypothetical protein E4U42_000977 [Claviceps africana]|uniref:Nitronate monooxygenase domain-containing protein n=1 Tax=Claviceps africana TaxID=83212 RepID=A0A8K0J9I9_9HYPO|nr:hypothetical protein E4U42_000977 [Claviceps africana]
MPPASLQKWFPWTKAPLICNGPMLNVVTPKLATEVTKAGGLGFLASVFDANPSSAHLDKLAAELAESQSLLGRDKPGAGSGLINVGVSFITGHESIARFRETALPVLTTLRPAALWLFAPDETLKPHGAIIRAVKALDPAPRVFVQVGNVAAAREAVLDGADVLVCQGIDAGGHQFRRGMGVVSFVPEVRSLLADEFADRDVAVLGAGGIADERGVAAAMVLGAGGVVMGTRFTVAEESCYPEFRKQLVLSTVDGGSSTLKSPVHDQVNNNRLWGAPYDGRAIMSSIHERFLAGTTVQDLQRILKEDYSGEEAVKLVSTWAGTGVGLVRQVRPAGEIVTEVREGAKQRIRTLAGKL